MLVVAALLLLVLALVARPGRRVVGLTAGLVERTIVEVLLPSRKISWPWVAAFHIVVAVAIAAQAAAIVCILSRAPAGGRWLDI